MKKAIKVLVGVIISVFFLWLAFRKADVGQVFLIIRQADVKLLLISFLVTVANLITRSYRWKLLGKDYHNVKWIHFFRATNIGLMLNVFLPFRTGDLFQSYFLSRKSGLAKSYTLSTVFLERLVDLFPPLIIIIIGSSFVALPEQISMSRVLVFLVLVLSGICLIVYFRDRFMAFVSRFRNIAHGEKIHRLFDNIIKSIEFLKDKQVLMRAVPLTLFIWLVLNAAALLLILMSLDIHIGYFGALIVMSITVLSVAIPSSPGFVGTWEFFCMLALSIFGVDRNRALSYAVLSHFMAFLPVIIFGLYFFCEEMFMKGKISLEEPSQ